MKSVSQNTHVFNGDLRKTNLQFQRPAHNGGAAPVALEALDANALHYYQVQSFRVASNGNYTITGAQDYPGFIILYSTSFDASSALTNVMTSAANNSAMGPIALSTGVDYLIVTTAEQVSITGTYTNTITGAGAIVMTGPTFNGPASLCPSSLSFNVTGVPPALSTAIQLYSNSACTTKVSTGSETPGRYQGAGVPMTLSALAATTVYGQSTNNGYGVGPCLPLNIFCAPVTSGPGTGAVTFFDNPWLRAWKKDLITIEHKADYTNTGESWSPVTYTALGVTTLPGGDLYAGELGVSGKQVNTSSVNQEIHGKEALRFTAVGNIKKVTLNLSRFYSGDDSTAYSEAGLVRALDTNGNVLAEQTFYSTSVPGTQQVILPYASGFSSFEVLVGCYNGATFSHGAYCNASGGFGTDIYNDGSSHGSDLLINSIQLDFTP